MSMPYMDMTVTDTQGHVVRLELCLNGRYSLLTHDPVGVLATLTNLIGYRFRSFVLPDRDGAFNLSATSRSCLGVLWTRSRLRALVERNL